jgi:hypothetical protein
MIVKKFMEFNLERNLKISNKASIGPIMLAQNDYQKL